MTRVFLQSSHCVTTLRSEQGNRRIEHKVFEKVLSTTEGHLKRARRVYRFMGFWGPESFVNGQSGQSVAGQAAANAASSALSVAADAVFDVLVTCTAPDGQALQ
eukprot:6222805-Amphidinium_carterae.1